MQNHEMMSHKELMTKIYEVSFAMNDMHLYLDTHPNDSDALETMKKLVLNRKKYMEIHAKYFGPLTVDCTGDGCDDAWAWILQPMPWENVKGRC